MNRYATAIVALLLVLVAVPLLALEHEPAGQTADIYDYRDQPAWKELSPTDQRRLERVTLDLILLRGAIDLYMQQHGGRRPVALDALVPGVLRELPADPFSTDGSTYEYQTGADESRDYCLASVGLPSFPYLAKEGNVGLYMCRGVGISGNKPAAVDHAVAPRPGLINHVVFIKLKDPAETDKLIEDCRKRLSTIPGVRSAYCGRHGDYGRSNINADYDVGLLVAFDDEADYSTYVLHPDHVALVQQWKPHMEWIQIYDIVDSGP